MNQRLENLNSEFDLFYQQFYANWPLLREALQKKEKDFVAAINSFLPQNYGQNLAHEWQSKLYGDATREGQYLLGSDQAASKVSAHGDGPFPAPVAIESDERTALFNYYIVDRPSFVLASVFAQLLQKMQKENAASPLQVGDFCSAPGGKFLMTLFQLKNRLEINKLDSWEWLVNEQSQDRSLRLRRNLENYLPKNILELVQVKNYDARLFGKKMPAHFDAILLDVPCSSERHVMHDEKEMKNWKVKRPKMLAELQFSLLCSAYDALKPGGVLLYSTCALAPFENEGQMERLQKKREGVQIYTLKDLAHDLGQSEQQLLPFFEARSAGHLALPTHPEALHQGPLYGAFIVKTTR